MSEKYTVLSPWAEADCEEQIGLCPRLRELSNQTIGLFANFKGHSLTILRETAAQLAEKHPDLRFTEYVYATETAEIMHDPACAQGFSDWVRGCDAVIAGYGDDGSSTMFHGMNAAAAERLGTPTVSLNKRAVWTNALRGAEMRMVPGLRCVSCEIPDLSLYPNREEALETVIRPEICRVLPEIEDALTRPLSEQEARPAPSRSREAARAVYTGTYDELNRLFYRLGFTNGTPIVLPTREAVGSMLRGTDRAPDECVGVLMPMRGRATVEKLAVNAVMAGCLPTHFPLVIAIAEAMADPALSLPGWQCSVAGFAPMIIVNGPVRRDIALNSTDNVLSPYYLANTSLARAMALITLNIAGIRPGTEDKAYGGHEARGGVCFGEDEENSPWEPYHVSLGYAPEDSTVTLVWFQNRSMIKGSADPVGNMKILCDTEDVGFNPGATFVVSHTFAKTLSGAGFTKQGVIDYVCEYARKSAADIPLGWLRANHHVPESVPLPLDGSFSARKYWDKKYLHLVVSTGGAMPRGCAMLGGGDHGGPITVRVQLPRRWPELLEEYAGWSELEYV